LKEQYQYNENPNYGGFSSVEYWPIFFEDLKYEG
jgi:hypothetical protein